MLVKSEKRSMGSKMKFSENLRQLREKQGLKQKELAEKLEISLRAYQYYERNEREPQLSTLIRIADYFDVSLDELVGRER